MLPGEILSKLKNKYPLAKCALNHKSVYELAVATILSAQCTDVRVNLVTPLLFEKYPTINDLANADIENVKIIIRSTGFFNTKAKNIIGFSKMVVEDYKGIVPDKMCELIKLPGVARKTANVVLGEWYKKPEGIAVDTHVKRLSNLLGLTKHTDPVKIEQDLMKLFPKTEWVYISLALIQYGRDFCNAKRHDTSKCFLGGHG
ncbi:endonuclease III [Candidatus Dojkabacteria bacterium]|nr:endonuclease III [Candidatus Dojkabacteria bacterium]